MADSSLMDVQRAQLCVHNCRVPCTSCCWLLLTPLLTQPSSPQGLIYGPCFLPSSVLPSLPEAYVIQPEATEHSYPKPSVQLSLQHLRPYGIETAMGGAPATPVLRVQCPRVLRSLCQLVYFQTRPYVGKRAGHPHPGRSLIQTQVPLSDKSNPQPLGASQFMYS